MFSLLFLIGQLRSKEAWSITHDQWIAMKNADSLAEFIRQIKDTSYLSAAEYADSFEMFESALYRQLLELKKDCFSTRKTPFDNLLWRKYDNHNIKILLKTKLTQRDITKYLLPLGTIDLKSLEAFILSNEVSSSISVEDQNLIKEAEQIYMQNKQFRPMDEYLDKELLGKILFEAKSLGGATHTMIKKMVELGFFKLGLSYSQVESPVEYSNIGSYEKALDDELSQPLFANKYSNSGITPVFLFFRGVEMEIKNLKILYLSHSKCLPNLAEYLRTTYVS